MTDTTTALTIVIPPQFHAAINTIRAGNDKAYPRWMPHINLIFPFVPEDQFSTAAASLETALSSIQPFAVRLNTVNYFKQKQQCTYNLQPSPDQMSDFNALFAAVQRALPDVEIKHAQFTPHMTLGQCAAKDVENTVFGMRNWLAENPVEFVLDRVCLIKRYSKEGQFEVLKEVYFGGNGHVSPYA
ncbi:hypothetical protein HDU79_001642 [Rhizoclosmatium sp. JEL0117]|nr:hypothetical protein HDU79_001642 [Rhizoclosmatium sp. JEL0117]